MSKWRIWWLEVLGAPPSEELAAAVGHLNGRAMRQARNLLRRGRAADDLATARCVVALAREHRRQRERGHRFWLVITLLLGLAGFGAAIDSLVRLEFVRGLAIAFVSGFVLFYGVLSVTLEDRNALKAEHVNREVLRRAGVPYAPAGMRTLAYVHPLVAALLCGIQAVLFMPLFGTATLLVHGEALSVRRIVAAGLPNWLLFIGAACVAVCARLRLWRPDRALTEDRQRAPAGSRNDPQ